MENKLELRVITANSIQKIVQFLVETGTEELLGQLLFETQLPDISWGELRQKAELTAEELKELQAEFGENAQVAALKVEKDKNIEIISQDVLTIKDMYSELMKLIADENKWNKTKEIIAYLYQTDTETIGEMAIKDIMGLVQGLMKDDTFTEALS